MLVSVALEGLQSDCAVRYKNTIGSDRIFFRLQLNATIGSDSAFFSGFK